MAADDPDTSSAAGANSKYPPKDVNQKKKEIFSSLSLSLSKLGHFEIFKHQKFISKMKKVVFHTQKTGRRRVVVSTEENIIALLDLRRGDIIWRHVLGKTDPADQIDIALRKYVVTLSSEGSTLRAWNLPDGLLIWETVLQVLKPLLYVSSTGAYYAGARLAGATPPPAHVLSRSIGLQAR